MRTALALVLLIGSLAPTAAFAGYQASPTSTTAGTDSSNATSSILRLKVTAISPTSSNVTFRLEKADGTSFRRGRASLRLGCGTGCTMVQEIAEANDGRSSFDFTVFMPSYVTGSGTGTFYGRFESTHPDSLGYWTWAGGIVVGTYPISPPSSLAASGLTASSASLAWGASTGANTYRYQVTTQSSFATSGDGSSCSNCVANAATSSTGAALSGLSASTLYRWRVRGAHSESGQVSGWSVVASFTTAPPPPPTIGSLAVSPSVLGEGQNLAITWTATHQHHFTYMLYDDELDQPFDTSAFLPASCPAGTGDDGCLGFVTSSSLRSAIWPVPAAAPHGRFRIKLAVWNDTGVAAGAFSTPFTLGPTVTGVNLSPSSVKAGDSQTITWSSTKQSWYMALLYDANHGQPIDTTAFNLPGCGFAGAGAGGCISHQNPSTAQSATWTLPAGLAPGQYTVKVAVWNNATDSEGAFSPPFAVTAAGYLNVSEWAQAAAAYLVAHGVVVAPANGDLRGTSPLDRAELATLLYRSLGGGLATADARFAAAYGGVPAPVFADVADPDAWYHRPATYLGLLAYAGDPAGITVFDRGPGVFRPALGISRAWAVKALLETLGIAPLSSLAGVALYPDLPAGHPAAGYVYRARERGLLDAGGSFRPDAPANREDLFVMLHRAWDSSANLLGLGLAIPAPGPADFARAGRLGRIGQRYEQPILGGVDPPSIELAVAGPHRETLGTLAGIYTAELDAEISSWDHGTYTDAAGGQHQARLFCAWQASGGSFIDRSAPGEPETCAVKWVAPIDVSAAAGPAATYQITLYVGDGLGSEVSLVHPLVIGAPGGDATLPTVALDPLPAGLAAGRLAELQGTVADGGDAAAPSFGILGGELFATWDGGATWSSLGHAELLGGGRFRLAWLVPRRAGNLGVRAEATNLRGNRRLSAVRSANLAAPLTIEGLVADSAGRPIVGAPVRLLGGGLDRIERSDGQGSFLFESATHGLVQGVPYRIETSWQDREAAVAGLIFSAGATAYYRVLRLDTAPPLTVATPGEGLYRDPIAVELFCADQDGECAATYYTVDGSPPTAASFRYLGPIPLAVDTTLRFFSVDLEGNAEPARQLAYTFDRCRPPAAGDWLVATSCTLTGAAAAPAGAIVAPGAVLTLAPGAVLEIDLHRYRLLVRHGGGVLVRQGGALRQSAGL